MSMVLKVIIELMLYAIGSSIGVLAVNNWNKYQKDNDKGFLFFCFWDMMLFAVMLALVIWVVIFV